MIIIKYPFKKVNAKHFQIFFIRGIIITKEGLIMIHSLSGGVITQYDKLIYVFTLITNGTDAGIKRWYISPYPTVKVGDGVRVPVGKSGSAEAEVLRVETVTAQTAPFPVNRTREIECILPQA